MDENQTKMAGFFAEKTQDDVAAEERAKKTVRRRPPPPINDEGGQVMKRFWSRWGRVFVHLLSIITY